MIRRIDDSWESSKIHDYSILALGRSKSESSANKLGNLLKNNNLSAMLAIGRSGKKEFLPPLIEKMGINQDKEIRRKSIEAVGLLGDNKALPNLIGLLDDTDAEIRQDIINALANIKDPSVIPSLANRSSSVPDNRQFLRLWMGIILTSQKPNCQKLNPLLLISRLIFPALQSILLVFSETIFLFASLHMWLGLFQLNESGLPL